MLQAGFAEVDVAVDHAGHHEQTARIESAPAAASGLRSATIAISPPAMPMSAGRRPADVTSVPLRIVISSATMASVKHQPRADPLLGFYGPDSMMWRINREAVLLGAGPAALLLQVAHPLVADGVAQHSTFEHDPFARLRGTIATTMDLVFGDGTAAERAIRRLNSCPCLVRGAGYRALDPELLLWVQATLIVTSVRAYSRWVAPLNGAKREQFWQEARSVGIRLGIPSRMQPGRLAGTGRLLAADACARRPDPRRATARRLAPLIVRPPLPLLPGPLIDLLALPGLALLPDRLRSEFAITWNERRAMTARALDLSVRGWVHAVPGRPRWMPQANAAYARLRPG